VVWCPKIRAVILRYLFLLIIKVYWIIFPEKLRRRCNFSPSCSQFYFDIVRRKGLRLSFPSIIKRYHLCRSDYQIIFHNGEFCVKLNDGSIIEGYQISSSLIKKHPIYFKGSKQNTSRED